MSRSSSRIPSLDALRGLVMVLMALDHASFYYNAGRTASDSALMWTTGTPLPLDQMLVRWIAHLCAPTFLFLAGAGGALSALRRIDSGASSWAIDRDLLIRGLIIIGIELLYIPHVFGLPALQVLYAIGTSMILMIALRRLDARWLVGIAAAWFLAGEAITGLWWPEPGQIATLPAGLLVTPLLGPPIFVAYPVIPWCAMMMAGWAFGTVVHQRIARDESPMPTTLLMRVGVGLLVVFVVVRGINGYGNMFLPRENGSLAQWLHASKYPPSLAFVALELGVMALVLVGFTKIESWLRPRPNTPLIVFGQTALFFYVAHFLILRIPGPSLQWLDKQGILETLGITAVGLAILFPTCIGYRQLKRRFPRSPLRYI